MHASGRFESLFTAIDTRDVDTFAHWLTDDSTFTYGSREPVRSLAAIRGVVAAFLAGFAATEHRVSSLWEVGGVAITEGTVTYVGHDERRTTLPLCNVFSLASDGRIRDYRIYVDPTPLS